MTSRELELRAEIMRSFAEHGVPPEADDPATLHSLADQHVVALDEAGAIRMTHPFAAHDQGARVDSGGRSWWGNCAWDALGIVAALGLREARVRSNGESIRVTGGRAEPGPVFHVAVPAGRWWEDIGFT